MRFHLPRQLDGVNLATLTPKISSTAFLISTLPASIATSKVYLLSCAPHHRTLSDDRLLDNVVCVLHYAYTSCSFSTAALSMMNLSALRMSYTLRVDAIVVRTPGMFAADFNYVYANFRSNLPGSLPVASTAFRKPTKDLVLISPISRPSITMISPAAAFADRADSIARRLVFLVRL